jgi:hypothetical protein
MNGQLPQTSPFYFTMMSGLKRKLRHGAVRTLCQRRYESRPLSKKLPSERDQKRYLQAFHIQILSFTVKSPSASPAAIVPVGFMSLILLCFSATG